MFSHTVSAQASAKQHPLLSLFPAELELMLQFVLASRSLKDLARVYQVSYPTIRVRVDPMIDNLRQVVTRNQPDPMMQLLADLVERAEITPSVAQLLREVYHSEKSS